MAMHSKPKKIGEVALRTLILLKAYMRQIKLTDSIKKPETSNGSFDKGED